MSGALRRRSTWLGAAVAASAAAAFLPALRNGFVALDDKLDVIGVPQVTAGLTLQGLAWAFTTAHGNIWHPVAWLSHMLDCQLYGLSPAGHHSTSLLLHAASAWVLYRALVRATGSPGPSAAAAALWALHPLRVESVAWVAERKDVLCALFWNAAMLAYVRYAERPSPRRLAAVAACQALALMSKVTAVTLPFALLLFDAWPLCRWTRGSTRARLIEKLPLFALSAAAAVAGFITEAHNRVPLSNLPLWLRVEQAPLNYAAYLWKTFWPLSLACIYSHPGLNVSLAASTAAALGLALVSAFAWRERARRPYLLSGWLWFLGVLFPTIGFFQAGVAPYADRYAYVPHIGLAWIAAWGGAEVLRRLRAPPWAELGAAGAAALVLGALTWRQTGYWKDSTTLFEHALSVTRDNYEVEKCMGVLSAGEGRFPDAEAHLREAIRIRPDYAQAREELARVLLREGRAEQAAAEFERALRWRPDSAAGRFDLGNSYAALNRLPEAVEQYREALRLDPDQPDIHNNLGIVLSAQGRREQAVAEFETALKERPGFEAARKNLALASGR